MTAASDFAALRGLCYSLPYRHPMACLSCRDWQLELNLRV